MKREKEKVERKVGGKISYSSKFSKQKFFVISLQDTVKVLFVIKVS